MYSCSVERVLRLKKAYPNIRIVSELLLEYSVLRIDVLRH